MQLVLFYLFWFPIPGRAAQGSNPAAASDFSRWRLWPRFRQHLARFLPQVSHPDTWSPPRRQLSGPDYLSRYLFGRLNPLVLIAVLLLRLGGGGRPTRRAGEPLQFHRLGWASSEELAAVREREQRRRAQRQKA